jgi:hypothetical protein
MHDQEPWDAEPVQKPEPEPEPEEHQSATTAQHEAVQQPEPEPEQSQSAATAQHEAVQPPEPEAEQSQSAETVEHEQVDQPAEAKAEVEEAAEPEHEAGAGADESVEAEAEAVEDDQQAPQGAETAVHAQADQPVPEGPPFGRKRKRRGWLKRRKSALFITTSGQCAVCYRGFAAGSEEALAESGWKISGELGLCPQCQSEGWQLPEGARLPYRRAAG